jgi:HNH endonuclease
MKSGKLYASNDFYIKKLLLDENYIINRDGTIYSSYTLQGHLDKTGNKRLTGFSKKGKYRYLRYKNKHLAVHRIVYAKFVGKLSPNLVINHIDGNPANNNPENLELVTQSENNKHQYTHLSRPASYGNCNLSFQIAEEIRKKRSEGMTYLQLSIEYKISKGHISAIINNKIWRRENDEGKC